ncbi:hypothetical protein THRCLA_06448 [Thraustotheca clavata]|uniref:Uncharacterized protein n=1 Tax=Thraustotheca clavata TaxID=74557 RepID=A0A1V9ZNQ4_9STRA|nr:hypothetical protein THRCLA_06448 [Thraustotheca clavata]
MSAKGSKYKTNEEPEDLGRCTYKFGKCMNPRTRKINGELHSLCSMHRLRQNAHQLKSDRKRREKQRALELNEMMLKHEACITENGGSCQMLYDLKKDVEQLIQLVKMVLVHVNDVNVDTCWSLLSLQEYKPKIDPEPTTNVMQTSNEYPSQIHPSNDATKYEWPILKKPHEADSTYVLPSLVENIPEYHTQLV